MWCSVRVSLCVCVCVCVCVWVCVFGCVGVYVYVSVVWRFSEAAVGSYSPW